MNYIFLNEEREKIAFDLENKIFQNFQLAFDEILLNVNDQDKRHHMTHLIEFVLTHH